MKTYLMLIIILIGVSCNKKDDEIVNINNNSTVISNITVDGLEFKPTKAFVKNVIANRSGELAKEFTLEKDNLGVESLQFKINYPNTFASAPNDIYQFGPIVNNENYSAQGSYNKGSQYYGLEGYFVKVTTMDNNRFKLEFQNIQAIKFQQYPPVTETIIISGTYEGQFVN